MHLAELSDKFVSRFNEPGPYYTSYPTLSEWSASIGATEYSQALEKFADEYEQPCAGLYIHFPFCPKQCLYCICNALISQDSLRIDKFLDTLEREIDLLFSFFMRRNRPLQISDVHLGGGSPSFLGELSFSKIVQALDKWHVRDNVKEFSIEIDPRTVSAEKFDWYREAGITRLSFGIQDFSAEVQKVINREQPFELVQSLLTPDIRRDFSSINFDILYGLPLQTFESFADTVHKVVELSPDRITLLRYAHMPESRPHQDALSKYPLPDERLKTQMFIAASQIFTEAGWVHIGIDHFAKPADSLAISAQNGTMQRSFIGFAPGWSRNLLGVGPTATMQVGSLYAQNVYSLDDYNKAIGDGKFPVSRGCSLDTDDLVRRDVINSILCRYQVSFKEIEYKYEILFLNYFRREIDELNELEAEGILELTAHDITVIPYGKFFLRQICKVFDRYLQTGKRYTVAGP